MAENKHSGLPPIPGLRDDRRAVEEAGNRRTGDQIESDWHVFLRHAGHVLLSFPLVPWVLLYGFTAVIDLYYFLKGLSAGHSSVVIGGAAVRTWTLAVSAVPFAVAAVTLVGEIYMTAADDFGPRAWRRMVIGLFVLAGLSALAPLGDQISGLEWAQFFGILFYAIALGVGHLVWVAKRAPG